MMYDRICWRCGDEFPSQLERDHIDPYWNQCGRCKSDSPEHPYMEEDWTLKNPVAFQSIKRGLSQVTEGKLHDLGSFAKYAEGCEDATK